MGRFSYMRLNMEGDDPSHKGVSTHEEDIKGQIQHHTDG